MLKKFRPELDIYYITDSSLNELKDETLQTFRRIFYRIEDIQELHCRLRKSDDTWQFAAIEIAEVLEQ